MKLWLSFSIQSTTDLHGKQHGNADALSRSNCRLCGLDFVSEEMEETSYGCLSTGVQVLPVWTKIELREMQEADPNLGELTKWLASGSLPVSCPTEANWKLQSLWVQRNFLLLEDGMLYRQWKDVEGNGLHAHLQLVLPANLVSEVLQGLHNSHVGGRLGARKVLEKARARFYWPGQRKDIEKWCHECAESVTPGSRHRKEEHRWKRVWLKGRLNAWQWIFWAPSLRPLVAIAIYW